MDHRENMHENQNVNQFPNDPRYYNDGHRYGDIHEYFLHDSSNIVANNFELGHCNDLKP